MTIRSRQVAARRTLAVLAFSTVAWAMPAHAALEVVGTHFREDKMFPEYDCFWRDRQYPGPCAANFAGANLHVLLKNTGTSNVTIFDVTLNGISLDRGIAFGSSSTNLKQASIYYSTLGAAQVTELGNMGEPVWFKADPATVAPGKVSQVVVRLRYVFKITVARALSVGVVTSAGTLTAPVEIVPATAPRMNSISFSPNLDLVYLYWERPELGMAPTQVLLDGVDVTANAVTRSDPSLPISVTLLSLATPLQRGELHLFQGVFADGKAISTATRAWANPFVHATWGCDPSAGNDAASGEKWVLDAVKHAVNGQENNVAMGPLGSTGSGAQFIKDHGFNFVHSDTQKWNPSLGDPYLWFVDDEPDNAEGFMNSPAYIDAGKRPGMLARYLLQHADEMRAKNPKVLTTINLDGSFKPYNYNTYGQVTDSLEADPYYQARLRDATWDYPERLPLYAKATYIYANGRAVTAAGAPNPTRLILNAIEYHDAANNRVFPYTHPDTKRTEMYYALAAGVKGLAHWWFNVGGASVGLGAKTPDAIALWDSIGVVGNEIRLAQPLIVTSTPVDIPITGTTGLWVRALAVGHESLILLVMNDEHTNDIKGCHYSPLKEASLTATLPSWLSGATAFEVSPKGITDVPSRQVGNKLDLNLCTVKLTRMIVVTQSLTLRAELENRYETLVKPQVCALAPTLCSAPTEVCPGFPSTGDDAGVPVVDAGTQTDAGSEVDAGVPGGPVGGETPPTSEPGCGCGAAVAVDGLVALALGLAWAGGARRRKSARGGRS